MTRGDPESPLRWTCKSTTKLAQELRVQGHRISQPSVGALLHAMGYSLQANRKTREGGGSPGQGRAVPDDQRSCAAVPRGTATGDLRGHEEKELVGNFKMQGGNGTRKANRRK